MKTITNSLPQELTSQFNNPIRIKNAKLETLYDAKKSLLSLLQDFSEQHPENSEEIGEIKRMIESAFLSKELEYLFEYKVGGLMKYIDGSLSLCLNTNYPSNKNSIDSKLVYLRHTEKILEPNYV